MLAPPDDMNAERVAERLGARQEAPIDLEARTRLLRADGSTTVIRPEYWQSLAGINPVKLYNRLAKFTALRIINAKQDDVLGEVTFDGIDSDISMISLDGGHNFQGEDSRQRLLYILSKELNI
jgi:hypothetical protein